MKVKVWIVVCSNYDSNHEDLYVANAKCFTSIEAAREFMKIDEYYHDDYNIFESEMDINVTVSQ